MANVGRYTIHGASRIGIPHPKTNRHRPLKMGKQLPQKEGILFEPPIFRGYGYVMLVSGRVFSLSSCFAVS